MSKKGRTIKAGRSKGVNGEGRRAGGDVARSQAVYFRDPASKPRNSKALAKQKELDQRLDKEKAERNLKKAAQIAKREDALEAAERAKSPYTHRLFNWLRKSAEGVAHQIVETISEILMPGPNQAQKRRASQESPAFEDFVSTPKNLRVSRKEKRRKRNKQPVVMKAESKIFKCPENERVHEMSQEEFKRLKIDRKPFQSGGNGQVTKVYDTLSRVQLVMKQLSPGHCSDVAKRSFNQELEMLKEARGSSQLLQIRSFFYTPEQDLMIFTEICQTDLLFYLTETQFDNSMIRHCAEDVTRGISFLHNRNIIHNDVKIENIFVKFHGPQKHPSYVLGDFGLARKISESEGVEGPAGTWGYMPPEVYRQERRYGLGLDWFAFAAVIYLLKVRHEAFTNVIHQQDSDYPDKLIEQSITDMDWAEEFPRPSCGDPDFTLWDLIAKIFVVKPEARLGYFHDLQVKNHAYFVGTNWHAECSECTYH